LIAVQVCNAGALATDREASAIEGSLKLRWAVGAKVDRAVGNGAALVVGDPHRKVVTVHQRDIVEVTVSIAL